MPAACYGVFDLWLALTFFSLDDVPNLEYDKPYQAPHVEELPVIGMGGLEDVMKLIGGGVRE